MEPVVRITEEVKIWFMDGGYESREIVHGTPTLEEYEKMYDRNKVFNNPNISMHLCIELDGDLYEWVEL